MTKDELFYKIVREYCDHDEDPRKYHLWKILDKHLSDYLIVDNEEEYCQDL